MAAQSRYISRSAHPAGDRRAKGNRLRTDSHQQTISGNRQPRLLDRLSQALRSRHYSKRTERAYCQWVRRFIFFHNVRHPAEMAEPEIDAFLKNVSTTMVYTHVLNKGGQGVRSPVDVL